MLRTNLCQPCLQNFSWNAKGQTHVLPVCRISHEMLKEKYMLYLSAESPMKCVMSIIKRKKICCPDCYHSLCFMKKEFQFSVFVLNLQTNGGIFTIPCHEHNVAFFYLTSLHLIVVLPLEHITYFLKLPISWRWYLVTLAPLWHTLRYKGFFLCDFMIKILVFDIYNQYSFFL